MEKIFTLKVTGIDFYVCQRGDHPDTIFVHGFGGDLHTWDDLWEVLPEDFSAIRYDLRGFGQSLTDDESPFSHADDLLAIFDALGIENCNVVGLSMGGAVALNFALNYPERVNKLVLISPGIVGWEWSDNWKQLWRPILIHARSGEMDKARELWWQHPLFASTRNSPGAQKLYNAIQRYAGAQWIRDFERPELPDVDRLHQLQPATLLLTGQEDVEEFRLKAELIAASAPDLVRVDLPGLGHLLPLEAPALCAGYLVGFLGGG